MPVLEEIGINAGNWVDSDQDRDYWRALVNATLNLRIPLAMELVIYIYYMCKCGGANSVTAEKNAIELYSNRRNSGWALLAGVKVPSSDVQGYVSYLL